MGIILVLAAHLMYVKNRRKITKHLLAELMREGIVNLIFYSGQFTPIKNIILISTSECN